LTAVDRVIHGTLAIDHVRISPDSANRGGVCGASDPVRQLLPVNFG
jgi:hypothetical protein